MSSACFVPTPRQGSEQSVLLTLGTIYRMYAHLIMSPGWRQPMVQERRQCLVCRQILPEGSHKGNHAMQWMVRSSSPTSPLTPIIALFLLPELLCTSPVFCTFTLWFLLSDSPLGSLPWSPHQGLVPVLRDSRVHRT